jgi:hypothetical protein
LGAIDLPKSPNVFHPEKPSAVGSRNSLAQENRDQQKEVDQLLHEETNKVIHHINSRLPKEVLERLDVMGGLKEKVYNYFNQNYQNMFNRYIVTTEDEMVKKVRNFIDKEEMKTLSRYTPKEIAALLDEVGGADKFNTGEIEKSMVNMFGHLQGHIQRGVNELENLTNSLLRQKTDVGAFIRGENAYSWSSAPSRTTPTSPRPYRCQAFGEHPGFRAHQPDFPLPGNCGIPDQGPDLQAHHRYHRQGNRAVQGQA